MTEPPSEGTAVATTVVAGVFYLGYVNGATAAVKQNAKAISEGATLNAMVSLARTNEKPIQFLWKFDDLEDLTKLAIDIVE